MTKVEQYTQEAIDGEIWKPIDGFERYQVSSMGRIIGSNGKVMSIKPDNRGYCKVSLFSDGIKNKKWVHRLVAQAFIPNPNNHPQINHKDENPSNNCVSNLEWCTAKYNANYGGHKMRLSQSNRGKKISEEQRRKISQSLMGRQHPEAVTASIKACSKKIVQIRDGVVVGVFDSAKSAHRETGINYVHICDCARGVRQRTGGFEWKYMESEVV